MHMLVMVLVIIGALIAIASGVWVAAALITAISSRPSTSSTQTKANEKTANQKT